VQNGQGLPSGTVITLVDYRDDVLHRYVVMEKEMAGEASTHRKNVMVSGNIRHLTLIAQ